MTVEFKDIGLRLKAYRLGRGLSADSVAKKLGVSRAAVYRLEKGEIVKIQTLDALSDLLDASLPSLLGVGVEYHSRAAAFFERMRQLEERATHILGNFSPISFLLVSDDYIESCRLMLSESVSDDAAEGEDQTEAVLEILAERRRSAARRRVPIVSIIAAHEVERFLRFGLVGRFDLPASVVRERRRAARAEVARWIDLIRREPIGVQVGVVEGAPANQTFQLFKGADPPSVTLSPYRLGDHPNISSGIALVTSAPEAVRLFEDTIGRLWDRAHKGAAAAARLQILLDRTAEPSIVSSLTDAGRLSKK